MIDFIASIFKGIAYAGGILLWNLGLAGAPMMPVEKPQTAALVQQIPPAQIAAEVVAVKGEIESLKAELAELKAQKSAAVAPKPKPAPTPAPKPKPAPVPVVAPVPVPVPVPVVVPAPVPAPAPTPTAPALPPGQFLTPSGAIVDSQGRLISAPPSVAVPPTNSSPSTPTPAPAPTPTWPPVVGTTVTIARYIAVAIGFNPAMNCNQLGFYNQELKLCELYKNSNSSYTWVLID